jgi:hypothetical protein
MSHSNDPQPTPPTYEELYNRGRDESAGGHPFTPQAWNETRREAEIRRDGYDSEQRY